MLNQLSLSNWKNHASSQFEFRPGANIIVGPMGSGKSSILQAISFALFGTFAELKSHDVKLAEVISRGSEVLTSEIALNLSINNRLISVKRKIDTYKTGEAAVRDESGVLLAGPNPTLANNYLSNLLGIKLDIFLKTIYAVQNDVDAILHMTPAERKKHIDELMGLDKFEVARSNCILLRNKLFDKKCEAEQWLNNLDLAQIDSQLRELTNQCENLKSKKLILSTDFKLNKEKLISIKKEMDILKVQVQEANSLKEQKKFLEKKITELTKKLAGKTLKKSEQEILQSIVIIKQQLSELQKQKAEAVVMLEQSNRSLIKLEKELGRFEAKETELNYHLIDIRRLLVEFEALQKEDFGQKIKTLRAEIEMKNEQRQANLAEVRTLREQLANIETAEGACPTCKSPLTEELKVELISERKKQIPELLYTNNILNEEIAKLKKELEEAELLLEKQKKYSEVLEEETKTLVELQKVKDFLKKLLPERIALENSIASQKEQNKSIEKAAQQLNEEYANLVEEKYFYESLSQKQIAEQELSAVSKELAEKDIPSEIFAKKESEYEMLLCNVREIETTLISFDHLLAEKNMRLNDFLNKKKQAEELSHNINYAAKKIEFLDKFKNALLVAQTALRDDLILAVNEVMTAVWLEIYPYEKWSGVRLAVREGDYILELKESEGEWVSVAGFASGGERMLAALAVRIAFARVLVPNLSLLILDEPTHNLDEQAIKTLTDVIRSKISKYVDQIFIVTHEEKLAEAAENVIRLG